MYAGKLVFSDRNRSPLDLRGSGPNIQAGVVINRCFVDVSRPFGGALQIEAEKRMRQMLVAFIATFVLTSCQTMQPVFDVPKSGSISADRARVLSALVSFLARNDIQVLDIDRVQGRILAARSDYAPGDWASCRPARVFSRDDNRRVDRGRPVSRSLKLRIDVTDSANGSEVRPAAQFIEQQINPFRNLPFNAYCVSTGKLERSLLDALGKI